ncbi:HTH-type transcriptional activator RhaS [Castellaniella defragrans]
MFDFDVVCDDRCNYSNSPHAHADDMLFLPIDGLFSVCSPDGNGTDILTSGNLWWVPGRSVHQVTASQIQRHLCYYLDIKTLLSPNGSERPREAVTARRWMMSAYLEDLLRVRVHLQRRSNSVTLSRAELDRAILVEAARIVSSVAATTEQQPQAAVRDIKAYVRAHLNAELNCGVLADLFGLAPRTLARWFQAVEGTSVGQFILRTRLEQARVLLQSTELPVSDIQDRVGFNSAAHFSYSMRRAFGRAPSQLRGQLRDLAKKR